MIIPLPLLRSSGSLSNRSPGCWALGVPRHALRASGTSISALEPQSKIRSNWPYFDFSIFYSQEYHGQAFKRVNSIDFCDAFRMYAIPDEYATDKLWFVSIIRKRHSGTQELLMRRSRVFWCTPHDLVHWAGSTADLRRHCDAQRSGL